MDIGAKLAADHILRAATLRIPMRTWPIFILLLWAADLHAQDDDPRIGSALGFSRSMSIPLNGRMLFDQVLEAWTWTFGKEPAAKLMVSDREKGILEGTARLNFRSEMLAGREESMGTVSYHVRIQVRAGECVVVVSGLTHFGNRNTARGGVHFGQLVRDEKNITHLPGMSHSSSERLHAELREASSKRINALLQTMEARIRANIGE